MNGTTRAIGPAGQPAVCGLDRSSLCARIVDTTERAGQKIDLQRLLPNLGVQFLQVRRRGLFLRGRGKHPGSVFQQLRLPLRDLVGMNVEPFRKRGKGFIALEGGDRHLRLERGCVVTAGSSHGFCSSKQATCGRPLKQRIHLTACPIMRGHFS